MDIYHIDRMRQDIPIFILHASQVYCESRGVNCFFVANEVLGFSLEDSATVTDKFREFDAPRGRYEHDRTGRPWTWIGPNNASDTKLRQPPSAGGHKGTDEL